jgi:hypothetical protein
VLEEGESVSHECWSIAEEYSSSTLFRWGIYKFAMNLSSAGNNLRLRGLLLLLSVFLGIRKIEC